MVELESVITLFNTVSRLYNRGLNPLTEICNLSQVCLSTLLDNARIKHQGSVGTTDYSVFFDGRTFTRPIRKDMLIEANSFQNKWQKLIDRLDSREYLNAKEQIECNNIVYTSISSFSCVFDLWKASSRKTPGTFFEILTGSMLSHFYKDCVRSKHITLPRESESVTTDIVLTSRTTGKGLVIPVKITTRERIVQPFVHQHILVSVFGDKYHSVLVSMSEMQRSGENEVNSICVPGTLRLFSRHLSPLSALVYLDPPERYLMRDVTEVVPVLNFGSLFTERIGALLQ